MTDTTSNHEEPQPSDRLRLRGRSARVNRRSDGEPIGASIFLTAEQLEELGLQTVRIEMLNYRVKDGELCVVEARESGNVRGNSSTRADYMADQH